MDSSIKLIVAIGIAISSPSAPSAIAQNCPEMQTAREQLVNSRAQKIQQIEQLQSLEAKGPETLEDQDRLVELRTERPRQIRAQLEQFKSDQATKRSGLLAERNRRIATLSRQRDQLSASNEVALTANQAKYNDLLAKGPQTDHLEAQARAAEQRETNLTLEKRRVLSDLHSGKFCSECGRSAYEIEKSGSETFEQHLVSVRGHAVMRPEQIQARSDMYDQQIAQAHEQYRQAKNAITSTRAKHSKSVNDTLEEITKLKVDGVAAVADLQQQIDTTVASSDRALDDIDTELKSGLQRFADLEKGRLNEEQALDESITNKVEAYDNEVRALRRAIADSEAEEAPLKARFLQAATQCRTVVVEAQQEAVAQDLAQRQAYEAAQRQFADASYQDTLARESTRRAELDAGRSPPVWVPSSRLGGLESLVRSAGNMIQSARRSWKEGLGLRETNLYRELEPTVRQKLDANIETLMSGRNTARAVLRDSIGRLREGPLTAMLRNALGEGNGLSPDLAAAVDSARPSLAGTVRKQLMPTIEAMAIETAVDARERQTGRSFDPQERVSERGYVRAMAYILDRKKQGEAMLETYRETIDTFMGEVAKDMGEEK